MSEINLTGLAIHLVSDGLIDPLTAKKMQLEAQKQTNSFIHYSIKNRFFTSFELAQYCSKKFNLPLIDLSKHATPLLDENILSLKLMQRYEILSLEISNASLKLGMADPTDQQAINAAAFYSNLRVLPVVISFDQLQDFLEKKAVSANVLTLEELEEEAHLTNEDVEINDEPLIELLNNLINHGIKRQASDIHIEPYQHHCRIRYRQNGLLYEATEIPKKSSGRLITRLKVLAKLDISEHRLPQDGRFQHSNRSIRINTCPTIFGEKIVLRLLDSHQLLFDIHSLGMDEIQKKIFIDKISKPQGMILVTGPTGSGKTVTLYSALKFLNTIEKNISTVEDPVEIQLPGINQVTIQPKIGLNFSTTLRTFLRQDPDIIMVGEIRDTETAQIAIQAAQTGHLVLSTLHTNNSIEAITRLISMGIPAYHLTSSISLIIAQRLIRILCDDCKQPEKVPGITSLVYRANQCNYCVQGYKHRAGIYEILPMTPNLCELILSGNNKNVLATAIEDGFTSLQEIGFKKVLAGETSLAELNRVL